jgi:hypothetical protein
MYLNGSSGQQAAVFMKAEIVYFTPKQSNFGFSKTSELYSLRTYAPSVELLFPGKVRQI